jgi:hypothetical protein
MRVLESILLFGTATGSYDPNADHTEWLVKDKERGKRDSFNRLVTIGRIVNHHTILAKGGNPDINPDYGLTEPRLGRVENSIDINNTFFNRNLKRMYFKENKDGELKCAIHKKARRGSRQRRSAPALDEDDWINYCEMLEELHDPEDGECTDCCPKDDEGNYITSLLGVRGIKTMGAFDPEDPESFVKNTRKLYTVMKKWVDVYLGGCKGQEKRHNRIINFMRNRLFNGIDQGFTNMEVIRTGRWKRVFPKGDGTRTNTLNKDTMIAELQARVDANGL